MPSTLNVAALDAGLAALSTLLARSTSNQTSMKSEPGPRIPRRLWPAAIAAVLTWVAARESLAATVETPRVRFTLSPEDGRYEITDKQAGVTWKSNPYQARFGEVTCNPGGAIRRLPLGRCQIDAAVNSLTAIFTPLPDNPSARLRVQVRALPDDRTLEFSIAADPALTVESVRLLDDALWTTAADQGYVVVPVREGLLIPADSGLTFTHRFDTFAYEGCHMEMLGVVKRGAAALVTWHDPYVAAEIRSVMTNAPAGEGGPALSTTLVLRKSARSFRLELLGKGGFVEIAKAYRPVAKEKGWLVPWSAKLRGHPERTNYFGASNYKLWSALDRRMNDDSSKELRVKVNWTFDEAAQVAEHLKRELKLDRVLFILGGWIHRGYDNQHPDILPTAPECGGDAAFSNACRRIRSLGYTLSLHDNYQDLYRDSPSWNEDYIMKTADGSLTKGGKWAGGLAYLTCSEKAVELARRPQNLVAVKALSDADSYFIDTTYAAGLQECFDRRHPLTRADDMKWKQAISDYAREVFGSFGSECVREWAIPHADFFEGLTGVSGTYFHNKDLPKQLGAMPLPLFEMVYRDCIAAYGKYGYDPSQAAEYVLHHITIGRPLHYHNVPSGLYWKRESGAGAATARRSPGDSSVFVCADNGWAEELHPLDRFVKNTHEILSPLNELTSQVPMTQFQLLTPDRKVRRSVFGEGTMAVEAVVNGSSNLYRHRTKSFGEVQLPPGGFVIEAPGFVAFHALNWNGLQYDAPVLFTLRSLDGQPLADSSQVRVFHGFGDARVRIGEQVRTVAKEGLVSSRTR
jgi:hypothetical protein